MSTQIEYIFQVPAVVKTRKDIDALIERLETIDNDNLHGFEELELSSVEGCTFGISEADTGLDKNIPVFLQVVVQGEIGIPFGEPELLDALNSLADEYIGDVASQFLYDRMSWEVDGAYGNGYETVSLGGLIGLAAEEMIEFWAISNPKGLQKAVKASETGDVEAVAWMINKLLGHKGKRAINLPLVYQIMACLTLPVVIKPRRKS